MLEKSRDSSRGYLIGLSATVFLSFTGILISYLNRTYNLPSFVLAFWRDLSVVLGLLIVFAAFKRDRLRLDRSHWSFFILYGLTLSLFNSMWTFSVQFNGAAIATVLAFSSTRRSWDASPRSRHSPTTKQVFCPVWGVRKPSNLARAL